MTALLIDLDGVIYEGNQPVPGAAETIAWLRDNGIPHLFLTNTTSRPRTAIVEKLANLGLTADEDGILTPPVAAARWLAENVDGPVALFVPAASAGEFSAVEVAGAEQQAVAALVIGDYAEKWTYAELNRAFRLLMQEPHPVLVALGMTRYWLAEDGLRLDTAPFVTALRNASGIEPVVLGKPARAFFDAALSMLGVSADAAIMIGDDVRGDVGGAQAAGIEACLVRTGKFLPADLDGDVRPDFVLDSIAALPERWPDLTAARGNRPSGR